MVALDLSCIVLDPFVVVAPSEGCLVKHKKIEFCLFSVEWPKKLKKKIYIYVFYILHRQVLLVTGQGCSQRHWAYCRESGPLTEIRSLTDIGGLTERPGLSQKDRASHRKTGPLTERPGLLKRGPVFLWEAFCLMQWLGLAWPRLSHWGYASHRGLYLNVWNWRIFLSFRAVVIRLSFPVNLFFCT